LVEFIEFHAFEETAALISTFGCSAYQLKQARQNVRNMAFVLIPLLAKFGAQELFLSAHADVRVSRESSPD
jgi:hypothetical protein